jgi:hypothetical protein
LASSIFLFSPEIFFLFHPSGNVTDPTADQKGAEHALGSSCISPFSCLNIPYDRGPFPVRLRRIKVAPCDFKNSDLLPIGRPRDGARLILFGRMPYAPTAI